MFWFIYKYQWVAVVWLSMILVIAHFMAIPEYDWTTHTIADLGAQGYVNNWITQLGFVVFGVILFLGSSIKLMHNKGIYIIEVFMIIHAISFLLSGLFSTAPFLQEVTYSEIEAEVHNMCWTIANCSLLVSLVLHIYLDYRHLKPYHVLFFLIIFFSLVMQLLTQFYIGLWSKILLISVMVWLSVMFNKRKQIMKISKNLHF